MSQTNSRMPWITSGDINAVLTLLTDNLAAALLLVMLIGATARHGTESAHDETRTDQGQPPAAQKAEEPKQPADAQPQETPDPGQAKLALKPSTAEHDRFPLAFVLRYMVPGTMLGVLGCGLAATWLARQLAHRTGRLDVTAMPVGLDTPSVVTMGLAVLLPLFAEHRAKPGWDTTMAMCFAWNVGMVLTMMLGLFKTAGALISPLLRNLLPRSAVLCSMAAIALAVILFLPMARDIGKVPAVGIPTLMIVIITMLAAKRKLPVVIPASVLAIVLGFAILVGAFGLATALNPAPAKSNQTVPNLNTQSDLLGPDLRLLESTWSGRRAVTEAAPALPDVVFTVPWWSDVWDKAICLLPFVLPLGLATLLGGIECVESASRGGDEYDTRTSLLADGAATILSGLCGGVAQTTLYFGHPAYKSMEGRTSFPLGMGLIAAAVCLTPALLYLFDYLPREALFPLIVFVGLRTMSHSLENTDKRHYPAFALAAVPVLAFLTLFGITMALGSQAPDANGRTLVHSLRGLANGFVITSLLWAAVMVFLLDGKFRHAAITLLIAAGFAFLGIIHSPLPQPSLGLPHIVIGKMPLSQDYQTPFQWVFAYVVSAVLVGVLEFLPMSKTPEPKPEGGPPAPAPLSEADTLMKG